MSLFLPFDCLLSTNNKYLYPIRCDHWLLLLFLFLGHFWISSLRFLIKTISGARFLRGRRCNTLLGTIAFSIGSRALLSTPLCLRRWCELSIVTLRDMLIPV